MLIIIMAAVTYSRAIVSVWTKFPLFQRLYLPHSSIRGWCDGWHT